MKIKSLSLKSFGPFKNYELNFPDEESICVLFTGKNNEGKSTIINALKLLDSATRVIRQKKQYITMEGSGFYKFLRQDTESLNIKRMIHNYEESIAEIKGSFSGGFEIIVYLNQDEDIIYADYLGLIPNNIDKVFGFIPPLGPLSESEDILSERHLRTSLNTSLAPRHLRNHFHQLLCKEEFELIKEIVNSSWQDIKLLDYEVNHSENKIFCYYKEKTFDREISWAGQGLQVWFQIITHVVRLRDCSILILDEPEINLHPEKQNDLIRILKEYYSGNIIIATHSIELMNNVQISHIVHVKKNQTRPKPKLASDRTNLELIRSQVGSNFNFIASQYEEVDLIIFTEDESDFKIINDLAKAYKINKRAFNIPLHGFSEYKKAEYYKNAYELLIGKKVSYSMILDRDYYPQEYLTSIVENLDKFGIKVFYTPGKEIENIFINPILLFNITPKAFHQHLELELESLFNKSYLDCHGKLLKLYDDFHPGNLDVTTINKNFTPQFNQLWNDKDSRYNSIGGKSALKSFRNFYRKNFNENLSDKTLIEKLVGIKLPEIKQLVNSIYQIE